MKTRIISILMLCFFFLTNVEGKAAADNRCENSKTKAKADLQKGKVNFLILGGVVSTHVKGQEVFEQKYKLKYFDFGCVMPNDICIEDYNATVAKYLDQTFGKQWRKEVRKDVKGI